MDRGAPAGCYHNLVVRFSPVPGQQGFGCVKVADGDQHGNEEILGNGELSDHAVLLIFFFRQKKYD
jgi:hypothetical protein